MIQTRTYPPGELPDLPAPDTRFRLATNPWAALVSIWEGWGLMTALAGRQLRVRYKHTILGPVWAVISIGVPLAVLLVIRKNLAAPSTNGAPGYITVALAMVPWSYFSSSVSGATSCLLSEANVVKRVDSDRAVFPLSRLQVAALDSAIGGTLFLAIAAFKGEFSVDPSAIAVVPVLMLATLSVTMGVALVVSVLVVVARDTRYVITLGLQFGLFITPVMYTLAAIPEKWQLPYVAVNPIAGVIDGLRSVLTLAAPPDWRVMAVTLISATVYGAAGLVIFRRTSPEAIDLA